MRMVLMYPQGFHVALCCIAIKNPALSLSLVRDPYASQTLGGLRLPRIQSTTIKRWMA